MRKSNRKCIKNYRIYWYKMIPFVIAEIINPEWESIKKIEKETDIKFDSLREIYTKDGGWFVLEGLDFFFLNKFIYSSERRIYSDSIRLASIFPFEKKHTDKEKYEAMIDSAKEDIDKMWKNFFKISKHKKI